jgi:hypothetical protein
MMPRFLQQIAYGLALALVVSLVGISCTHRLPCTLPLARDDGHDATCAPPLFQQTGRTVVYAAKPAFDKVYPVLRQVAEGLIP